MPLIPRKPHPNNRLANLPPADRQRLLDWLESHTYPQVQHFAAEPRPAGLGLKISYGALVRFRTRACQQQVLAKLETGPSAEALLEAHPADLLALNETTRQLLQHKTIEALQDPELCLSENPRAAHLALRLLQLDLRARTSLLRQVTPKF